MIRPSKEEFIEKSKQGNLIPVVKEILADFDTPVSAYLKIAEGDYSFLLESVEGSEKIGRYSFLGSDPKWVFSAKGKDITLQECGQIKTYSAENQPLDELRKLLKDYRVVEDPTLPRFLGGAVGYVGYGMVEQFDGISQRKTDDLGLPDAYFILADTLVAFDHVDHRIKIIANAYVQKNCPEDSYEDALKRIQAVEQKLSKVKPQPKMEWNNSETNLSNIKIESNFSKKDFETIVEKAKEYIRAGDIFQVVLSQRFCMDLDVDSITLYRALRSINPSPYMFLLNFKDFHLVGTSPEILVRCEDGKVEVRPIAGTKARGYTAEEDQQIEKTLLEDPKERAEHLMLVDLGRNDLGRVCKFGSVHVSELMVIEKYSHVMHIVSDVTGSLENGVDAFDVLKASFPAGTVTGAPKIRAMQIIEELENLHRGPYAGAVGYYSFSGDLDSCITIRTILLKDGKAYIQAGAGIVADSVPEREYQETLNKAKGMIKAISLTGGLSKDKGKIHVVR
jgi:anthranilate synthase component 1